MASSTIARGKYSNAFRDEGSVVAINYSFIAMVIFTHCLVSIWKSVLHKAISVPTAIQVVINLLDLEQIGFRGCPKPLLHSNKNTRISR